MLNSCNQLPFDFFPGHVATPNSITFINHATVLLQLGEFTLITDPVYSYSISFFLPRLRKPGIPFDDLPGIDYILISHNHYDHLNLRTLRRLRRRGIDRIVVPRDVAKYGRRTGFKEIVELEWWKQYEQPGLTITCVPAQHFSGRKLWDRNGSTYCGYVVQADNSTVYFAGDTGRGAFLKEIADRFSIDVALLPIGAYKPYEWFKNIHLSPERALQAFHDLRARHLVPIHWGTFKISDEPMAEPPALLRDEAIRQGVMDRVHILENGMRFEF
ncbi:MAG TPA: MBL fold metallo-hydrolase [Bacteroidetes bacterium]|nr:MBL fold metallo-hydrolase [Bacteroidota bacterium]